MTEQHTETDLRTPETLKNEVRALRYQKKQLGKQLGRAGATIYQLRNEIAALRQALEVKPGDYERLFISSRELRDENRRLREKLATKENV